MAAITEANLTSGTASSAASAATASITPTANRLVLLAVTSRIASGTPNQPTASGNGLTWVVVASLGVAGSLNSRITLFRAMGGSPSAGAVTIDFAAQSQTRIEWSIVEFGNVVTAGSNGSAAVVQSNTADSGTAQTAVSLTLNPFLSSTNRPYSANGHNTAEGTTPRTNWAELHDVSTQQPTMETQWRSDLAEATASASWTTSGRALMVAIEIACADQTIAVTAPNSAAAGGIALGGLKATADSSVSPTAPDSPSSAPAPAVQAGSQVTVPSINSVKAPAAAGTPSIQAGSQVAPTAPGSPASAPAPAVQADSQVNLSGGTVVHATATAAATAPAVQAGSAVSPTAPNAPAAAGIPTPQASSTVTVSTIARPRADAAAPAPAIQADVSAEVDATAATATATSSFAPHPGDVLGVHASSNVSPAAPNSPAEAVPPALTADARILIFSIFGGRARADADAPIPIPSASVDVLVPVAEAFAIASVPFAGSVRHVLYEVLTSEGWETAGPYSTFEAEGSDSLWTAVLTKG